MKKVGKTLKYYEKILLQQSRKQDSNLRHRVKSLCFATKLFLDCASGSSFNPQLIYRNRLCTKRRIRDSNPCTNTSPCTAQQAAAFSHSANSPFSARTINLLIFLCTFFRNRLCAIIIERRKKKAKRKMLVVSYVWLQEHFVLFLWFQYKLKLFPAREFLEKKLKNFFAKLKRSPTVLRPYCFGYLFRIFANAFFAFFTPSGSWISWTGFLI